MARKLVYIVFGGSFLSSGLRGELELGTSKAAQTFFGLMATNRAVNMIKASFVSDAATMGLHWIYDQKSLANKVGTRSPAFFDPPSCPFYTYPQGALSPYGDESLPLLRSLARSGGFDPKDLANSYFSFFSDYDNPSKNGYGYAGRLNHAPKMFVAAHKEGKDILDSGADDLQAQGIAKVPLLVARYAGSPELLPNVEAMVRILQKNELSVISSRLVARILERVLLFDESPKAAIEGVAAIPDLHPQEKGVLKLAISDDLIAEWKRVVDLIAGYSKGDKARIQGLLLTGLIATGSVSSALAASWEEQDQSFIQQLTLDLAKPHEKSLVTPQQALASVGLSCSLPQSLFGSLYIARTHTNYEDAVQTNILCGGDNCSRAMVIGALFGPNTTLSESWAQKLRPELLSEIETLAEAVQAQRTAAK